MKKQKKARSEAKSLKEREIAALEKRNNIDQQMIGLIQQLDTAKEPEQVGYQLPAIHPAVVPKGSKAAIAQDSCGTVGYANADPQFFSNFMGYQRLAYLAQSSDYRAVAETTANEMTREWGKVKIKGDGDDETTKRIELIENRLKELNVKWLMRKHIETEMFFGRSQLSINIKGHEETLNNPLTLTPAGVPKGSLEGFSHIEPIWSTPSMYNSIDPMAPDFFIPSKWFVLSKEVHSDRLLTLIMRPVSDMMKPAYNFSGISMTQLMHPYVQRWQQTVDSVSELIKAFSITGLKTDMGNVLSGGEGNSGASQLILRAQLFSMLRNNLNTMLIDKDAEEIFQVNTPLSGLDSLVQKAQEQMASPSHTPLVKLLGITPSGLNANSDGEIRVYNDYIKSLQTNFVGPQIEIMLKLVQLDLFGEINESFYFDFASLHQLTDEERAAVNKIKAETAVMLVDCGAISSDEVRTSLAADKTSDYSGVDPDDPPDNVDLNVDLDYEEEKDAA